MVYIQYYSECRDDEHGGEEGEDDAGERGHEKDDGERACRCGDMWERVMGGWGGGGDTGEGG